MVVFLADDLGAHELGCYGHPDHRTPNLDRLAEEGTRFETFWATPVCTPSRVLALTGQYPNQTGYYNFHGRKHAPIPGSELGDVGRRLTFPDLLRDRGYATACAGKWQLTGELPDLVHDCGFDTYRVWTWKHGLPEGVSHTGAFEAKDLPARYRHPGLLEDGALVDTAPDDWGPDLHADFLIRFMTENRDRPFLAYFPMSLIHTPWGPAPVPGKPGEFGDGGLAENVEAMDRIVGRVLDALKVLGVEDRTLVVFTADNGTQGAGKNTPTARGVSVPLIVRWPGVVPEGVVSEALGELSDLFPTLAAAAGASVPEDHHLDGVDQLPVWTGRQSSVRDTITSFLGDRVLVRDANWVLEGDGRLFEDRPGPSDAGPMLVKRESHAAADAWDRLAGARNRFEGPWAVEGLRRPADRGPDAGYSIPVLELPGGSARHIVVDREEGQYLGHPTTLLLEDGQTLLAVYPKGHGRGGICYRRSEDGGLTWSDRLPVPESWASSMEVPTLHRVVAPDGTKRIVLFSGLYPIRMSVSDDDGLSWSELEAVGDYGGIVAMGSVERLRNGDYLAWFHDDGRFLRGAGERTRFDVFQVRSRDGGLTWSPPRAIATHPTAHLCEPGCIRSPDGRSLVLLLRENSRRHNSFAVVSHDEGETWSQPVELSAALTGDRHTGRYLPDGRLFLSFRDTTLESDTWGDWVGWVGQFEDLLSGSQGQYRVRLGDNLVRADCAYPGVEVLPDGTIVSTTYGHWSEGESPYVVCVRFQVEELDAQLEAGTGQR